MPTWSPNSRKCSALKLAAGLFATAAIVLPALSYSAVPKKRGSAEIERELRKQLMGSQDPEFAKLIQNWEDRYGTTAVKPLLKLASDRKVADTRRFMAIMGATKIGGSGVTTDLHRLLKDSSWMVRSASLRSISMLRNPQSAKAVFPLLKDKALVVRSEAVETLVSLNPPGTVDALIESLESGVNYHRGRAQIVPQKILTALVALDAKSAAPRLAPLLKHDRDPSLQALTLQTLETLTGKKLGAPGSSLKARLKLWDAELSRLN